jgi:hypothetical protein
MRWDPKHVFILGTLVLMEANKKHLFMNMLGPRIKVRFVAHHVVYF